MIADLLDPAGFMVAGGVMGFWLAAPRAVVALFLPAGARPRPPRHTRPRGWVGPAMAPPSPMVPNIDDETAQALRITMHRVSGDRAPLSPLNREVMRRRFRVAMAEAHGRRLV